MNYTLPSHNPPNTHIKPKVATKDLEIVLNNRLRAEHNVVSATNKACRIPFYMKRSYAALTPNIFLPLYLSCRDAEALEKVQKLALKFVKRLQHVPYEAAFKQIRLSSLTHRRIRGDLIAMLKITHGLLEFPMAPTFAHPTRKELRGLAYTFHQRRCCTRRRQFAITIRAVLFWNKLQADIVNASSVESFKTLLDAHWKSQFPEVPI